VSPWTRLPLPAGVAGRRGPSFAGRLSELAELERTWAAALEGRRQVVFVGGEPGVGKTRLANEAAVSLHEHGAAVLWGACYADLDVPYRPFVTALDELFDTAAPGSLRDVVTRWPRPLTRLSSHARRHLPHGLGESSGGPEGRLVLVDALADLLLEVAAHQPVVVVLEDLQWASTPTLQLLAHLVRAVDGRPVLWLVTYRTTAPDRSDELTDTIADLYRLEGVNRLDLDGLGTHEITEYLVRGEGLSPERARASAVVLRDQTAGNPFFLHELWRDLSTRGGIAALRGRDFRAPRSVRDTLGRRLAELADTDVDVIELAAVAGEVFELDVLLEASEHAPEVTFAAVDVGVASGLVTALAGPAGRYAFVHALVRQAVRDRLPPSRQVHHHGRVAAAIELRARGTPDDVAQLAYHYERAQALGHRARAVRYLTAAGQHAERILAHEEAADLYTRAAALAHVEQRAELALAAAHAVTASGAFAEARQRYADLTTDPDPDVRLRAAIGFEEATWRPGSYGQRALDLLEAAAASRASDGTDPLHVRALASIGRAASFTGDARRAGEVGERALQLARQLEDDDLLAHALAATLWRGMTPALAPVLLARAAELVELGRRTGSEHLGPAAFYRALFGYLQADAEQWSLAHLQLRSAARASGQPFFLYVAACEDHARRYASGDLSGARRTLATLRELGSEFGDEVTDGSYGVQAFMLERTTGRLEQVRRLVTGDEDLDDHWAPGLLALYTDLGLAAPARRVLHHLLDRIDELRTTSATWAGVLAFMADAAVRLEDRSAAASLHPHLREYLGRNLVAGQFVAVFGSADRELARVEGLLGASGVEDRLEAALDVDRRMGAVTHQVETLTAWSHHCATLGGSRAGARAHQLAAEARALAARIGHVRALHDLGPEPGPAPPAGASARLTEREIEVLRLVADGLSNRAIGEQLFISPNTAANHVRSILTKTATTNRTQAAMYAADHDLLAEEPR
jgi:DNA-binding CsgD family transcriptional regulator/tetratricopeptide (TPR) repeat protein